MHVVQQQKDNWRAMRRRRGSAVGATENAGLENAAPDCRGGKRGSSTVWKAEVSVI